MAENNGNYATKADLKALRSETKADLDVLRDEIIAGMSEAIHDSETRMLKAFYGFAEAIQKRTVNVENGLGGVTGLLATMDRRVTELEKKSTSPALLDVIKPHLEKYDPGWLSSIAIHRAAPSTALVVRSTLSHAADETPGSLIVPVRIHV